jgi:hypothetical protein
VRGRRQWCGTGQSRLTHRRLLRQCRQPLRLTPNTMSFPVAIPRTGMVLRAFLATAVRATEADAAEVRCMAAERREERMEAAVIAFTQTHQSARQRPVSQHSSRDSSSSSPILLVLLCSSASIQSAIHFSLLFSNGRPKNAPLDGFGRRNILSEQPHTATATAEQERTQLLLHSRTSKQLRTD